MKTRTKRIIAGTTVALAIATAVVSQQIRKPEPVPERETAVHTVYLPVASKPGLKRGYAWAWWASRELVATEGVDWYYRYNAPRPQNPYPTLELIPSVLCNWHFNDWQENYPRDYAGYVLWLNEPLSHNQCPMSPEAAYEWYVEFRAVCERCKIIGPQMEGDPLAREWFADFMSYSPDIDGIGLHHYCWFGWWEEPGDQLAFYESYGLPIWVTEMGCDDPVRLAEILQLYEASPAVARVAYFAPYVPNENEWNWPANSRLFDDGRVPGDLTAVGRVYLER